MVVVGDRQQRRRDHVVRRRLEGLVRVRPVASPQREMAVQRGKPVVVGDSLHVVEVATLVDRGPDLEVRDREDAEREDSYELNGDKALEQRRLFAQCLPQVD